MKMKNCRNCFHAEFSTTNSGRRDYSGYAKCTFTTDVKLPLSLNDVSKKLNGTIPIYTHDNVAISCDTWVDIKTKD